MQNTVAELETPKGKYQGVWVTHFYKEYQICNFSSLLEKLDSIVVPLSISNARMFLVALLQSVLNDKVQNASTSACHVYMKGTWV